MNLYYKEFPSPVGKLKIIANDKALVSILWEFEINNRVYLPLLFYSEDHFILKETETKLIEFFNGERTQFDVSLEPLGTEFQRKVWKALQEIPYGSTTSYSEIAIKIQNPKAIRAVGTAIGRNPISIIIPCHRVIGRDGQLRGFAGGLDNKAFLLDLEKNNGRL